MDFSHSVVDVDDIEDVCDGVVVDVLMLSFFYAFVM